MRETVLKTKIAQYSGAGAIVLEWFAVLFFLLKAPKGFDRFQPFSRFETIPQTRWVFTLCLGLSALSYWLFVKWHLSKRFSTPTRLFAGSLICIALVSLVPFDPNNGLNGNLHKLVASAAGVMFVLAIYRMYKTNDDPDFRLASLITLIWSAVLGSIALYIRGKSGTLLSEVGIGLAAQVWTLRIMTI